MEQIPKPRRPVEPIPRRTVTSPKEKSFVPTSPDDKEKRPIAERSLKQDTSGQPRTRVSQQEKTAPPTKKRTIEHVPEATAILPKKEVSSEPLKKEFKEVVLNIQAELPSTFSDDDINNMLELFNAEPIEKQKSYLEKYKARLARIREESSPESLKKEFKKVVLELLEIQKKYGFSLSNEELDHMFELFASSPIEIQKSSLEKCKKSLESRGWVGWIKNGFSHLADRTIKYFKGGYDAGHTYYQEGKENVDFLRELTGFLASVAYENIKESIFGQIGSEMLNLANTSVSCVGNFALSGTLLVAPFIFKEFIIIGALATGAHDPENPELTTEAANEVHQAIQTYLNQTKISDRPINDLTEYITDKLLAATLLTLWKNSPQSLIPNFQLGRRKIIMNFAKQGAEYLPEYIMTVVMNRMFTEIFGAKAHPLLSLDSALLPIPYILTPIQISVLTSCVVTMLLMGNVPLKQTLIQFLVKGPASLKSIGVKELARSIQKKALGKIDPYLTPILGMIVTKVANKTIVSLMKPPVMGLIKGTGEITYDVAAKKIQEQLQSSLEPESSPKEKVESLPEKENHPQSKKKNAE